MLHSHHIIHRDLKDDNILICLYDDKSYPYKFMFVVADAGIAKEDDMAGIHTRNVGNPFYRAPEVDEGKYDERADIYSIGSILFKMLCLKHPFDDQTESQSRES